MRLFSTVFRFSYFPTCGGVIFQRKFMSSTARIVTDNLHEQVKSVILAVATAKSKAQSSSTVQADAISTAGVYVSLSHLLAQIYKATASSTSLKTKLEQFLCKSPTYYWTHYQQAELYVAIRNPNEKTAPVFIPGVHDSLAVVKGFEHNRQVVQAKSSDNKAKLLANRVLPLIPLDWTPLERVKIPLHLELPMKKLPSFTSLRNFLVHHPHFFDVRICVLQKAPKLVQRTEVRKAPVLNPGACGMSPEQASSYLQARRKNLLKVPIVDLTSK